MPDESPAIELEPVGQAPADDDIPIDEVLYTESELQAEIGRVVTKRIAKERRRHERELERVAKEAAAAAAEETAARFRARIAALEDEVAGDRERAEQEERRRVRRMLGRTSF